MDALGSPITAEIVSNQHARHISGGVTDQRPSLYPFGKIVLYHQYIYISSGSLRPRAHDVHGYSFQWSSSEFLVKW
jgi:hypothetical protein